MTRPYIICHMVTSVDGKVTGDFLFSPACATATEHYYQLNRDFQADAFACGRVTMQESFCGNDAPDVSGYAPADEPVYVADTTATRYAVSFDPHGRCRWTAGRIVDADGDPGYDNAHIIEVLTAQADARYRAYLQAMGVSYIVAGDTALDIPTALDRLRTLFRIDTLLLEGGSIVNGGFAEAGVIDELSLIVAPVIAQTDGKPLFSTATLSAYRLADVKRFDDDVVWLRYKA